MEPRPKRNLSTIRRADICHEAGDEERFWSELQRIVSEKGMDIRTVALNLRDSFRLIGDDDEAERIGAWIATHYQAPPDIQTHDSGMPGPSLSSRRLSAN